MKFYIHCCWALQRTRCHSYLKQLICSCLASWFSGKATKVGSPPNFSKLISHMSQLWGIPQPQYFITLLLDLHWTYFWKHYIYSITKTTPTLVAKILATKFVFVTRLFMVVVFWFSSLSCHSDLVSNLGFRAFPRKCFEGMAWNFACWCILTTFRTTAFS